MLRWPRARGPNSRAPSIQPTMRPAASSSATRSISARRRVPRRPGRPRAPHAPDRRGRPAAPRTDGPARRDPDCRSRSDRHRAPRRARSRRRLAPDGTNTRSKPDSARMRALATPFSATPPPRQRSAGRSRDAAPARDRPGCLRAPAARWRRYRRSAGRRRCRDRSVRTGCAAARTAR